MAQGFERKTKVKVEVGRLRKLESAEIENVQFIDDLKNNSIYGRINFNLYMHFW